MGTGLSGILPLWTGRNQNTAGGSGMPFTASTRRTFLPGAMTLYLVTKDHSLFGDKMVKLPFN